MTIISGLEANEVDLEVAKKFFASKFCCGCSKGDKDELIIQGDFVDQLLSVIPEKFPQVASTISVCLLMTTIKFPLIVIDHWRYDRGKREIAPVVQSRFYLLTISLIYFEKRIFFKCI